MSKMIRATGKIGVVVNPDFSFNPVRSVTGTTPANPHRIQREEKSDFQLLKIYIDNFTWFTSRQSRKGHCSGQILGWKIDQLGGIGAAW